MENTIGLEELKKIELDLLAQVDAICREQNLRYSLGGGTLLGAVRHKGFIPWDDDIDFMMPRPDYDKFIEYCKTNDVPFGVRSPETDPDYTDLSAKIFNPDTVLIDNNIVGDCGGVSIDLFPIEGLGNTYESAKKAFRSTRFKRELLVAAKWKRFFKSKTHAWYYEPARFVMFVLSRFINPRKIFARVLKRYRDIDFDASEYVGAVGGSYREKEILPRELYKEYVELPFEDKSFMAICGYDGYMKSIYGDYMRLPPEEKRVSHHTFTAYYKDSGESAADGESSLSKFADGAVSVSASDSCDDDCADCASVQAASEAKKS